MSTRDLINAIAAGDALEIENAFNATMTEKVSSRIDELRIDVAQDLFAEEVEDLDEDYIEEAVSVDKKPSNKDTDWGKIHHNVKHNGKDIGRVKVTAEYHDAPKSWTFTHKSGHDSADQKGGYYDSKEDAAKALAAHHIKQTMKSSKQNEEFDQYYNEIVEELGLENYSIEQIEEYMMSEDFEQLDELSKTTLASYIDKATSGKRSGDALSAKASKHGDKKYGYLTTPKDVKKHEKKETELYNKAQRRYTGVDRAFDKLSK